MAKDPVCGMEVAEEGAKYQLNYEGEIFYFCSEQCKNSFSGQEDSNRSSKKKGFFARFLERLAKENNENYGGKGPSCH